VPGLPRLDGVDFRMFNDPSLWKVAWDAEGVAGQVKLSINTDQNEVYDGKRGWTEAISTSRRWRRQGVAKALIVESIRELVARGIASERDRSGVRP
jgi:hypothetical protein